MQFNLLSLFTFNVFLSSVAQETLKHRN